MTKNHKNKPLKAMKCLFKHLKPIACLFALLMLSQSCVVYKSKLSSLEETSHFKNKSNSGKNFVKITTKDGTKQKFKWVEENDGNVVSKI